METKLYTKESIAKSQATRRSVKEGKTYKVLEVEGGWTVFEAEDEELVEGIRTYDIPGKPELIGIVFPKGFASGNYVYSGEPVLGKHRWFKTDSLYELDELNSGGITVILTRKSFLKRGLIYPLVS